MIVGAFVVEFFLWGIYLSFGVFLTEIERDLGESRAAVAGVFSVSSVVFALFCVLAGRLADHYGPRWVVTLGTATFGLGLLIASVSTSIWMVHLSLGVLVGIGLSGSYVPLMSMIPRWFKRHLGLFTGIALAGASLGSFVIPLVATHLIGNRGWRHAYLVLAVAVLALGTPLAALVRRGPIVVPAMPGSPNGNHESRIYQNRVLRLLAVSFVLYGVAVVGTQTHLVAYLVDNGALPSQAALVLAIVGLAGALGSVLAGVLGQRFGVNAAYVACFVLCGVSIAALSPGLAEWAIPPAALLGMAGLGVGALIPMIAGREIGSQQLGACDGRARSAVGTGQCHWRNRDGMALSVARGLPTHLPCPCSTHVHRSGNQPSAFPQWRTAHALIQGIQIRSQNLPCLHRQLASP